MTFGSIAVVDTFEEDVNRNITPYARGEERIVAVEREDVVLAVRFEEEAAPLHGHAVIGGEWPGDHSLDFRLSQISLVSLVVCESNRKGVFVINAVDDEMHDCSGEGCR